MKKLLGFLASLTLISSASSTVVACNEPKGNDNLNENNDAKEDLSKLKIKDLEKIDSSTSLPTIENIVNAINSKNENYNLTTNDVIFVGEPTVSKAVIKASDSSTKFSGQVEVTYKYSMDFDISALSFVYSELNADESISKNQEELKKVLVQDLTNKLDSLGGLLPYPIDVNILITMVNIEWLKADNSAAIDNQDVPTKVKVTIIEGHEYDVQNYHLYGSAEAKVTIINKKTLIEIFSNFKQSDDTYYLGKFEDISLNSDAWAENVFFWNLSFIDWIKQLTKTDELPDGYNLDYWDFANETRTFEDSTIAGYQKGSVEIKPSSKTKGDNLVLQFDVKK